MTTLSQQAVGVNTSATDKTSGWNTGEIFIVSLFVVVASATVLATAIAKAKLRRRVNKMAAQLNNEMVEMAVQHDQHGQDNQNDQTSVLQSEPNLPE